MGEYGGENTCTGDGAGGLPIAKNGERYAGAFCVGHGMDGIG